MSRGARWTLGSFALLFAAMINWSEHNTPSRAPLISYSVLAFCVFIAVACFSRSWRGPAVRVIGITVFLAYVAYLVNELLREPTKAYAGESAPHWLNATRGLIEFGLPGLYVAARGKYPKWGKGAVVFRGEPSRSTGGTTEPPATRRTRPSRKATGPQFRFRELTRCRRRAPSVSA
jgi:hypothetical protein